MSRLSGKTALITGASRGIGAAAARLLGAEGARVVRVSRTLAAAVTPDRLDIPCDLTDPARVDALAAQVLAAWGAPDLLVSNAGAFLLAPLERTSPDEFDAQVAANLRAPFLLARAFLPAMRHRGSGRLITVGSIADHQAFPENAAYAASKAGLRALHDVLRAEYRGSGVRCSLVSPGATDTAAWDPVDPDRRPGFTPRRAMLTPEDVAEAIVWIATRPPHVDVDWLRLAPAAG